jgi:hypothetical protein
MLTDPLPIKIINPASHAAVTVLDTVSLALIDLAPGRSVRKVAGGFAAPANLNGISTTLTISHSVSKENGSVPTDRTLVRLDYAGFKPSSDGPASLKGFAYIVIGSPRGAVDNNDVALDPYSLFLPLLGIAAVSPTAATLDDSQLYRIVTGGEP